MKRMTGFLVSTAMLLSVVNANAADAVKIGAIYALTGPGAVAGGDGMRGTELAISELNAAGGLKNHGGAQIELIKGDSQSKPINAVGETERFNAVKINGVKATQHLEPFIPCLSSGTLHERVKAPRFSKEHYNQVRHVGGAAPVPLRGSIASHVP